MPATPTTPTTDSPATRDAYRATIDSLVEAYAEHPRSSARTLLSTIFGDSVEAHGGIIWLGSLVELLAPLRINERLVRTSIHRLVLEGFLVARQVGRRSYYSVTNSARGDFRNAERRVYHRAPRSWDGDWTLVVTPEDLPTEARALLSQRLGWLGFGRLNGGTWAHPTAPLPVVAELLDGLDLAESVALLRGRQPAGAGALGNEAMARRCCDLGSVELAYRELLARYAPVYGRLGTEGAPAPDRAFLLRTLLIDDYRRIILRDPQLPDELLPPAWIGDEAHQLVAAIYRGITEAADAHLEQHAITIAGPLPPVADTYRDRFAPSA